MKIISICLAASLLLMTIPANAQNISGVSDNTLGQYILSEFEKTHYPGMTVQIVDAKSILFTETYGNCSDLDAGFIIGSLSKSFTAVGIMQLVEQGKLNLSDPIENYLNEPKTGNKATVLQLLNHTSGIAPYDTMESYTTSNTPTESIYSNVNYGLLGKIIECVSGMNYGAYLQANIFEPLGMKHSFTSLEQAKIAGMMQGYRNYFGLMMEAEYPYPSARLIGWNTIPSTYVISSTNDIGRYMQMFLNNGAEVLKSNSIDEIYFNSVPFQDIYQYGMGLGTIRNKNGELLALHGGNTENYTTSMIIMPERGIAIIAMFNACDYFIANHMADTFTMNILNKFIGLETDDLNDTTYFGGHLLINVILFIVLLLSVFPLIRIKRWKTKHRDLMKKSSIVFASLLHVALPTFILLIIPIFLGFSISVIKGFIGFSPDLFIVLAASSSLLYFTGIVKLIWWFISKDKQKRTLCLTD